MLHNVADLVVDVAVCEHCVEVLDALLGIPVVVVLQAFFYCAHVHRSLDDLIVVLEGEQVERIKCVFCPGEKLMHNVRRQRQNACLYLFSRNLLLFSPNTLCCLSVGTNHMNIVMCHLWPVFEALQTATL